MTELLMRMLRWALSRTQSLTKHEAIRTEASLIEDMLERDATENEEDIERVILVKSPEIPVSEERSTLERVQGVRARLENIRRDHMLAQSWKRTP